MRTFRTGATRDADDNKFDYEGFLSPLAIRRYGEYMHKHRRQQDGQLRASDNWQKGIDLDAYAKSLWRHHVDVWLLHRGVPATDPNTNEPIEVDEALCGVIFNAMGYLHEVLKTKAKRQDLPVEAVAS